MASTYIAITIFALFALATANDVLQPSPQNYIFNEKEAFTMVKLSFASYCNLRSLNNWNCTWCKDSDLLHFKFVGYANDSGTDTFGFVGYLPDTVVVSFRGSQSLSNWITNLKFSKETPYPAIAGASVHSGFFQAYQAVRSQVRRLVIESLQKCGTGCKNAIVTGHSLGGALATLASIDESLPLPLRLASYTYGSPRVGNQAFSEFVQQKIETWRLTHDNDIVPHLPPTMLNFHHTATEVWEHDDSHDQPVYKQCNSSGEDPTCADSVYGTSIADHLTYMGEHETCSGNAADLGIHFPPRIVQ